MTTPLKHLGKYARTDGFMLGGGIVTLLYTITATNTCNSSRLKKKLNQHFIFQTRRLMYNSTTLHAKDERHQHIMLYHILKMIIHISYLSCGAGCHCCLSTFFFKRNAGN